MSHTYGALVGLVLGVGERPGLARGDRDPCAGHPRLRVEPETALELPAKVDQVPGAPEG